MISDNWSPHCFEILEKSKEIMVQIVNQVFKNSLPIRYPALFTFVEDKLENCLDLIFADAKEELVQFLEMEKVPYTQNQSLFEIISKERNKHLKNKILKMINGVESGHEEIIKAAFEQYQNLSIEEHGALEMQIVLDTYGKVSAKRFMDEIPMIIQKMFRSIIPSIEKILQKISDKELSTLMTEDYSFVIDHNRATDKRDKMDVAYKALKELQTGTAY
jgi:hypothetical protein